MQQSNGSNVNVFYSTPSCYLYALNQLDRGWTSKTDDFFPYAHHPHGFWTGYFTSRAAFKRYERHSNNILQVTRQLNAFANISLRDRIFILSEHHDYTSEVGYLSLVDLQVKPWV
jgi:lysosomal alpha-mannosidase